MTQTTETAQVHAAMRRIPCGLFIMSSAHDSNRAGVLTRWVQPAAYAPPLVMVAIPTGLAIETVIRDSRAFALSQIADGDRLLRRRFAMPTERGEDPFITLPHELLPSGCPVPERALAWLDCELIRHVDLDADHRLFVGRIVHAQVRHAGLHPAIEVDGHAARPVDEDGSSAA